MLLGIFPEELSAPTRGGAIVDKDFVIFALVMIVLLVIGLVVYKKSQ
jgi:hypothetical protein